MRHTIKIAVMIMAVFAATMSGLALAQTDDAPEPDPAAGFQSRVLEQLAPLVQNGVIDQDQANAIAESFTNSFNERREAREERRAQRQENREELLDLLEMTAEDLRAAFQEGLTLADVAEQQGVPVDDVIDLMTSHAEERISQAVADGKLTAEEAEEKLAEVTAQITDKVNNGGHFGGHRGHRGPGGRGFGPGFGPGPGAEEAPATDAVNA